MNYAELARLCVPTKPRKPFSKRYALHATLVMGCLVALVSMLVLTAPILARAYHAYAWTPVAADVVGYHIECEPTYYTKGRRGHAVEFGPMPCMEATAFMQGRPDKKWFNGNIPLLTLRYELGSKKHYAQAYTREIASGPKNVGDKIPILADPHDPAIIDRNFRDATPHRLILAFLVVAVVSLVATTAAYQINKIY